VNRIASPAEVVLLALSLLLALAGCSTTGTARSEVVDITAPAACLTAVADREARLDCLFEVDDPAEALSAMGLQEKLRTGMQRKLGSAGEDAMAPIYAVIDARATPAVLSGRVRSMFGERLSDAHLDAMLEYLGSSLGTKELVALERMDAEIDGPEFAAWVEGPDPGEARLETLLRLDDALDLERVVRLLMLEPAVHMTREILAATPEGAPPLDTIEAHLAEQMQPAMERMHNFLLNTLLFGYRSFSDEELDQVAEFWGRRSSRAYTRIQGDVTSEILEDLYTAVGRAAAPAIRSVGEAAGAAK